MRYLVVLAQFAMITAAAPSGAAEAGFDLGAMREAWPAYDSVILERSVVFAMPSPDVLRVTESHSVAILQEDAREHYKTFDAVIRPGCREVSEVSLRTVIIDGTEMLLPPEDLVELPRGDHPSDPALSTVDLRAPRRGLAPGSLLVESWQVDYPAACYSGLLSTVRTLGDRRVPVLRESVEVSCAGGGCSWAIDRPMAEAPTERAGGGVILRREHVLPPSSEPQTASGQPQIYVSSSDDPLAVGAKLHDSLEGAASAARAVAAGYVAKAAKEYAYVPHSAERIGRYLSDLELMEYDSFWMAGLGAGEPPKDGIRTPSPVEWLAIARAALEPHGGIPILLGDDRVAPPPVGNVVGWSSVGVLVPQLGIATHNAGWRPLFGETNSSLAGYWMLTVAATPVLSEFGVDARAQRSRWTGTVEVTQGSWARFDVDVELAGSPGESFDHAWNSRVHGSKKVAAKRRKSPAESQRSHAGMWLFKRDIAHAEFESSPDEPFTVSTIHTREGVVQKQDGVTVVTVPLLLPAPDLVQLAGIQERESDFSLTPRQAAVELTVVPPTGFELAGLPEGGRVDTDELTVGLSWTEREGAAVLSYEYEVSTPTIPGSKIEEVRAAAELAQRAQVSYVLFVASATTPE